VLFRSVALTTPVFDVVLMDLQMPEMSGFEATGAIRDRERSTRSHVPIVALTAHAMAGDRERCLAAGMDGYLSKPIEVNDLIATVEQFGIHGVGPAAQPVELPLAQRVIFDEKGALTYTGGDRRLLKEVVALFRSDFPASLRRIQRALRRRDSDALRLAAHALKGAIATVGSPAGREVAAELESMAKAGSFVEAERVVDALPQLVTELERAFVAAGLAPRSVPRKVRTRARVSRTQRSRR